MLRHQSIGRACAAPRNRRKNYNLYMNMEVGKVRCGLPKWSGR